LRSPDLDISLVMTAPSGLAVIRGVDAKNTGLVEAMANVATAAYEEPPFVIKYWQRHPNIRCIGGNADEIGNLLSSQRG